MSYPRDTSRKLFKRELVRIVGNLEWAITHLERFIEAYAEHHPDLAAEALAISTGVIYLIKAVQDLDEKV